MPLDVEVIAVEGDDSAGLLATMLQGVQAERDQGRGLRRVIDAEDPAIQPGLVIVGITQIVGVLGGWRCQCDFSTASSRPLRAA